MNAGRRFWLSLTFAVMAASGWSCAASKDAVLNCGLEAPPATAGEMGFHAQLLRIFPRTVDMPPDYTGCQSVWEDSGAGKYRKISESLYTSGKISRFSDFSRKPGPLVCEYTDGSLRSAVHGCPGFNQANAREESLPAGCLKDVAQSRLGSDHPCLKQLQ